ncbi:MAG: S8 family peptidase, partial [Saprospiraceae bacterium]
DKATYVFNALWEISIETQKEILTFLKQANAPAESLFIVNAIKSEGSREMIEALAQREDVAQIVANPLLQNAEPIDVNNGGNRAKITWGIDTIKADEVWSMGFRGQGVVVGGADTGYEWTHPALKNQYRGYDQAVDTVNHNYNWHDAIHSISPLSNDSINPCGLDVLQPCDDRGHGTHTMGTMTGLDGEEQIGVAPEAEWCACRNMERGNGSPFTYLECFQWFLAPTDLNNKNPDPTKAPHVINNSWGCPESEGCDSSNWLILDMAINILRLSGVVVVVSAGNGGSGCGSVSNPPAMYEGSFSVGATAENDTIAGFSSRGPVLVDGSHRLKPIVSAPGVRVRSSTLGGNYGNSSGTSMAGPHVAGLVALIISANPDLSGKVEIIEDIIERTAIPKTTEQICGGIPGSEVPNNTYGFGRIDALAAVHAAIALIPVSTYHVDNAIGANVYPNPVDHVLTIDLQNITGEARIEIYDAQGRLISHHTSNHQKNDSIQIDFSKHVSGIYFYRILVNGNMVNGKVVKN